MKKLRKTLFYLFLTLAALVIGLVVSAFLFKDRIINEFIREANKQLNTPVKIGKLDVSMFEQFPLLSIVCTDVYIEDSHPGIYPLFTATQVSFQMNPLEVWRGIYTINGLKVRDSETNLKLNAQGKNNFTIVKKTTGTGKGAVTFELNNVGLHKTKVHYLDLRLKQDLLFTSQDLLASIGTSNDIYDIDASGDVTTDKFEIGGSSFLEGKSFAITSNLLYDDTKKHLTINPSDLSLKNSQFVVKGTYEWKEKNLINIETNGRNTDIQTLISLLPENASERFEKYQSKGDVYFSALLKGEISKNVNPSVTVDFGFSHATLFHPDYKSRIEDASIQGSYASADLLNPKKGTLVLKNISGSLNNETFAADLVVSNFKDPEVICNFKGKMDAESVLSFYPMESLEDITGTLLIDVSFDGKIALLKNKATAQKVSAMGTVELQDINLIYGSQKTPVQNLRGNLQFSNNDLALSNVSGKLGHSDFRLNGFFKNVITFMLFEDQPIGIETDLKATFIDLDEIFDITFGNDAADDNQQYTFSISKNVNLNFNCDIGSLRYKRFRGKNLRGDLLVKSQMAVSRNFALRTMGGELQLSGIVDAQNQKAIDVVTSAKLKNIHADSVFYVFDNFHQDFIKDKHLKGQVTADVSLEMVLNQHLKLFPETLIADIGATIKNGELNNFEPMKKLSRYLDDEGLSKLRFSELKNDIHIENKTIYLPQMEVKSNVTNIVISGTHTFDQRINYRLITPLRKKKVTDPEAQLAIEDDPKDGPKLFLKIVGTTDDYKILYDTDAVKKKIVSDLKKEVQELKDAFKTRGKQKEKELELQKDDYFDWEQD